jgi:hypothetical protein
MTTERPTLGDCCVSGHADGAATADTFLAWIRAGDGALPEPAPSLPDLLAVVASALAYADKGFDRAGAALMRDRVACAPGCACCCSLPVETTPAEALYAWLWAEHLADARFAAIATRGGSLERQAGTAPAPGIPCPFLEADGRCAVYAARPLACRGWNSIDAAACRAVYDGTATQDRIPVQRRYRLGYANVGDALARGLAARGLPCRVELREALRVMAACGPEEYYAMLCPRPRAGAS